MSDLVTVIIPTYNYGRFVGRAVTSVLEQTYPHLECIVVDDGSTDDTRQVLAGFGERIRKIHQENRGLSGARNRGVSEARGSLIAFLDADDWWVPEKIATQVRWLQQYPSVGCLGCGREHFERDGTRKVFLGIRNNRTREDTLRALTVRTFWIGGSGSGAIIRKDVLAQAGAFDEGLTAAEDWDMWLRLSALADLDNVPEVLVNISRHGTGVFRNVQRMEENQWIVYEKAIKAWPSVLTTLDRRKMRALILADAAGECLLIGRDGEARSYVSRSLREWPFNYRRWKTMITTALRIARANRSTT